MIEIDTVREMLASLVDVPVEMIAPDASMDDLEEWDSLAQMNLVLAIEEELGVTIPDEEVGTMISIPLIVSLLNELDV